MNTPVNFELAKLLKEKGYNEPHFNGYIDGELNEYTTKSTHDLCIDKYYLAPTIAEVVMWLYEKHGVWVYCEINKDKFYCKAKKIKSNWRRVVSGTNDNQNTLYNTPTEAYEVAIKYVLENLL